MAGERGEHINWVEIVESVEEEENMNQIELNKIIICLHSPRNFSNNRIYFSHETILWWKISMRLDSDYVTNAINRNLLLKPYESLPFFPFVSLKEETGIQKAVEAIRSRFQSL